MAPITVGMAFVFLLVLGALVLFAIERVPVDVTAIGVMVALLLVEPITVLLADLGLLADPVLVLRKSVDEPLTVAMNLGLSGFASAATITVLAMFILSEGVRRTGIIQVLGDYIGRFTGDSESRQLGATVGIVAPISGFINNTAAVAVLIPMVSELAHKGKNSPSKLLMPLSFASMFGGMLTLIGTSTNILASQLWAEASGSPFGMFQFTQLGVVLTVVGTVYLMTVGRKLVPGRIDPREDLTAEFEMAEYLTEVVVREDSPIIDQTIAKALTESELDVDIVQLIRGESAFLEPFGQKTVEPGDVFAVRTDRDTLLELLDVEGLDPVPGVEMTDEQLETEGTVETLVEVVVAPGSDLLGSSLKSCNFRQRYDATVLAIRRGQDVLHERLDETRLRVGDALLIQADADRIERLDAHPDFIVASRIEQPDVRESKMTISVAIVAAVVVTAAATPVPVVAAALAGALAMVLSGCLRATELYDAIQWDVIFLLAGVIPLGIALERTGGADLIADLLVAAAPGLPSVVVLGMLYVVTALLTNIVSNNASVVLMIPVALETASVLGANAFSFVLGVTFAASTAFMTPVGYQTNLFVYGPGGYKFTDFVKVGAPLQAVFAVVTTFGIAFFWGV